MTKALPCSAESNWSSGRSDPNGSGCFAYPEVVRGIDGEAIWRGQAAVEGTIWRSGDLAQEGAGEGGGREGWGEQRRGRGQRGARQQRSPCACVGCFAQCGSPCLLGGRCDDACGWWKLVGGGLHPGRRPEDQVCLADLRVAQRPSGQSSRFRGRHRPVTETIALPGALFGVEKENSPALNGSVFAPKTLREKIWRKDFRRIFSFFRSLAWPLELPRR